MQVGNVPMPVQVSTAVKSQPEMASPLITHWAKVQRLSTVINGFNELTATPVFWCASLYVWIPDPPIFKLNGKKISLIPLVAPLSVRPSDLDAFMN